MGLQMNKIGAPKGKYKRWHRYNLETNEKQIKGFIVGYDASNITEAGYTNWIIGSGKLSDEHYNKLMVNIDGHVRGIPKSEITRQRMRDAKVGVPKSESHKAAMALAHKQIWAKRKAEKQ